MLDIGNVVSNLDALTKAVSSRLDAMESREAVIAYLDQLEADIPEHFYGDMLYEHAYEYAQAVALPKFANETVSRKFLKARGV